MNIPTRSKIVRVRHPEVPFVFNVSFREHLGLMFMKPFQDHEDTPKLGKHQTLDREWIAALEEQPFPINTP